ncbi:unnamed protein product [Anisakis simplex]|uniref:Sphingomyelin synthase-related 2 (inferred by orthology to a C. elegans protein) n=1 Tax=Anisakis simplex TaxID=6269 RepID=A0A0M3JZQ7_ANISI|nr:unnamed protein product [Anisakis simplex]
MKIVPVPVCELRVEKFSEPRRTPAFISLSLLIVAWLLNETALAWIHEKVPNDSPPLPDLWFSIFPEVPVPSVKTYCAPKTNASLEVVVKRVMKIAWSAGIEQLRAREFCGDLIISGHTITLFSALLAFKQYSPRKLSLLAHLYSIAAVIAVICILLARKHYTIDVIFGYLVSSRTFWTYHSIQNSYHNNDMEKNAMSQSCWSWVVPYFEKDAPPPQLFINRLIWPSSCPQRIRRRWA